jgi:hypothetical protein
MIIILNKNPPQYSFKLQEFPTALRFAISQSDVVWLLAGIHCSARKPKSHDGQILIEYWLRERTSADVCLKWSLGDYMKLMLTIKSCCTISITIPNVVTVKIDILFCSR